MNETVGIEASKVLLMETNFSLNKFDAAKLSVFIFFIGQSYEVTVLFFLPDS